MFKAKHPLAFLPVSFGLLVLVLSLFLVVIKTNSTSSQDSNVKASREPGALSLSPSTETLNFKSGSYYSSGLVISSGDQAVKRVDVQVQFDPTLVMVDPQINSGSVLDTTTLSQVDNRQGRIYLSAENNQAKKANGILASFRFQPLRSGLIKFSLQFNGAEAVDDSNIINSSGEDMLTSVANGEYVVNP